MKIRLHSPHSNNKNKLKNVKILSSQNNKII